MSSQVKRGRAVDEAVDAQPVLGGGEVGLLRGDRVVPPTALTGDEVGQPGRVHPTHGGEHRVDGALQRPAERDADRAEADDRQDDPTPVGASGVDRGCWLLLHPISMRCDGADGQAGRPRPPGFPQFVRSPVVHRSASGVRRPRAGHGTVWPMSLPLPAGDPAHLPTAPPPLDDRPTLRASGPSEILQVIPYLLGFHPERSVVLVAMRGKTVVVSVRYDLAAPPELAEPFCHSASRAGATGALVVIYDDDIDGHPLAHREYLDALARAAREVRPRRGRRARRR